MEKIHAEYNVNMRQGSNVAPMKRFPVDMTKGAFEFYAQFYAAIKFAEGVPGWGPCYNPVIDEQAQVDPKRTTITRLMDLELCDPGDKDAFTSAARDVGPLAEWFGIPVRTHVFYPNAIIQIVLTFWEEGSMRAMETKHVNSGGDLAGLFKYIANQIPENSTYRTMKLDGSNESHVDYAGLATKVLELLGTESRIAVSRGFLQASLLGLESQEDAINYLDHIGRANAAKILNITEDDLDGYVRGIS